jgi:hypothetical protein
MLAVLHLALQDSWLHCSYHHHLESAHYCKENYVSKYPLTWLKETKKGRMQKVALEK